MKNKTYFFRLANKKTPLVLDVLNNCLIPRTEKWQTVWTTTDKAYACYVFYNKFNPSVIDMQHASINVNVPVVLVCKETHAVIKCKRMPTIKQQLLQNQYLSNKTKDSLFSTLKGRKSQYWVCTYKALKAFLKEWYK